MIRLVPNTGIQYADLPDIARDRLVRHDFQMRVGERFSNVMPMPGPGQRAPEESDVAQASGLRSRSADMRVLDRLLTSDPRGVWLPLPFEGGALWVALRLRKDTAASGGTVIRCTLAVDTTLDSDGNPDGPSSDELGERAPMPTARRFWRCRAVESWLRVLARRVADPSGGPSAMDRAVLELQAAVAGLADFLARDSSRSTRVLMERRPTAREGIVVDMVLDLGNSRTCALLEERIPGGRRQGLELRYPDAPEVRDPSPFSTQSALFEHEIVPGAVSETVSFRFLSVLKLGTGAREALKLNQLDPRPLGISTPKRYLWESYGRTDWKWRFSNRVDDRGISPTVRGALIDRMDPQNIFGGPPALPDVTEPDHPRAACMTWTIVDLLEQAFQQVNSVEWRRTAQNAPMCDRRRTIQNLIIIYPAGLHSVELRNFQKSARLAARLWSLFRSAPEPFCSDAGGAPDDPEHALPVPRVQMVCDEGMAIQLCWLYGEAMHRFGADAATLIDALGRVRPVPADHADAGDAPPRTAPTLRLASIDIGGGTIDLAVADFTVRPGRPSSVSFECERRFYDSVSRAGDDVVRGMLEDHVFPSLVEQLGCGAVAWNRVLGTAAASSESVHELRRELVRDVWMPLAMRCLAELEQGRTEAISVRIGDACSTPTLLARLRDAVCGPAGAHGPRLEDVQISISRRDMRRIVRNSIGRTLEQCADIVDQFDCDLLIVGGRPSSNREIREQIYAAMAVPPGQVVFLSELGVDDWYPFADRSGTIHDAKTAGVVGGSVAYRARYAIGPFTVDFRDSEEPSPIIGFLRHSDGAGYPEFPDSQLIRFGSDGEGITFPPQQPLVLASRRVDDPSAEARPIYRVRLKRSLQEDLLRWPGIQSDVTVRLELRAPENDPEPTSGPSIGLRLVRDEVLLREGSQRGSVVRRSPGGVEEEVDAERALEIRPCTLMDSDGYWIDTGVFRPIESDR
jgi:hypothetical protein